MPECGDKREVIKAVELGLEEAYPYMEGHAERVAREAGVMAGRLGYCQEDVEDIKDAGRLLDIGMLDPAIHTLVTSTTRSGPAYMREREIRDAVERHPVVGAHRLEALGFSEKVVAAVRHHHEWFNGWGYPDGLAGSDIPLAARILAVSDAYVSMISARPYRAALTERDVIDELIRHAGVQFDPVAVEALAGDKGFDVHLEARDEPGAYPAEERATEFLNRFVEDADKAALFTDLDGTIVPIASRPERVVVGKEITRLLERLAKRLNLVGVISGRPATEVRALVEARGVLYLGLHGLEETTSDGRTSTKYDDALRAKVGSLVEAIRESPEPDRWDLTIETKGPIVAVHYRESQVKLRARDVEEMRRWAQDLADLHGFDLMPGRKVFEFKPRLEIDKGTAVMRAAQRAGSSMVLYLGDDRSDIDAFRAIHNSTVTEGVAVAVLSEEMPAGLTDEADLSVNEVSEAVELLRVLVQRLEH
jgi:trehalose 6-phosphate phosphatase